MAASATTDSPAITADDERWLGRALSLARQGRFTVDPNPCVGAVVVRRGQSIAEGYHRRCGEAHAEIDALSKLEAGDAKGATLYVNLEPCSHHGRTPPCVDAVIAAGLARVVLCHRDPNPEVSGRGIEALRRAGVEVAVGGPVERAVALNLPFVVRQLEQRPAVTLKWAMSLDGKIATSSGESQWISSPAGRRWALELRELHAAILVGSGTVLADDPRLTRRLAKARGAIVRVLLDRRLRVDEGAALLAEPGPVLIYTSRTSPKSADQLSSERAERLRNRGATVIEMEEVTPRAVVEDLGSRGVGSLLVEGGAGVLEAFVREGAYDRVAACCAPVLIGGRDAPGPLGGQGAHRLDSAPRLERMSTHRRGDDWILEAWRQGCLPDLLQSLAC